MHEKTRDVIQSVVDVIATLRSNYDESKPYGGVITIIAEIDKEVKFNLNHLRELNMWSGKVEDGDLVIRQVSEAIGWIELAEVLNSLGAISDSKLEALKSL